MTHGKKLSKGEREARRLARSEVTADAQASCEAVLELAARGEHDRAAELAEGSSQAQLALIRHLVGSRRFKQAAHHCRRFTGLTDDAIRELALALTNDGERLGAASLSHARALCGRMSVGELALEAASAPEAKGGGTVSALEIARVGGARLELELARTLLRSAGHRLRIQLIASTVAPSFSALARSSPAATAPASAAHSQTPLREARWPAAGCASEALDPRCLPELPAAAEGGAAPGGSEARQSAAHAASSAFAAQAQGGDGEVPRAPGQQPSSGSGLCALGEDARPLVASALRSLLQLCRTALWPDCALLVFGSHAYGLAQRSSDLDVCLLTPRMPDASQPHARAVLSALCALLRGEARAHSVCLIASARVPVLRLYWQEGEGEALRVDVVVNNVPALCNTALLGACMSECAPMRQLCLAVAAWARAHRLIGTSTNHVSAYLWQLMVLVFLQARGLLPRMDAAGLVRELGVRELAADAAAAVRIFARELQRLKPPNARAEPGAVPAPGSEPGPRAAGSAPVEGTPSDLLLTEPQLLQLLQAFALHWAGAGPSCHGYRRTVASVRASIDKALVGWQQAALPNALSFEDPIETWRDLGGRVPMRTVRRVRCALLLLALHLELDAGASLGGSVVAADGVCAPVAEEGQGGEGDDGVQCAEGLLFALTREEADDEAGAEAEGEGERAGGGVEAGFAAGGPPQQGPRAESSASGELPRASRAHSSCSPRAYGCLVASEATADRAFAALRAGLQLPAAMLALDCEGVALSRTGLLCTVQLAASIPHAALAELGLARAGCSSRPLPLGTSSHPRACGLGQGGLGLAAAAGAHEPGAGEARGSAGGNAGLEGGPQSSSGGAGPSVVVCFVLDMLCPAREHLVACLRPLLESEHVRKTTHDCRGDADALAAQANVRLSPPLLDTQIAHALLEARAGRRGASSAMASLESLLAEAAHREQTLQTQQQGAQPLLPSQGRGGGGARGGSTDSPHHAANGQAAAARAEQGSALLAALCFGPLKHALKGSMSRQPDLWAQRPLSRALVRYAAADATAVLALTPALVTGLRAGGRAEQAACESRVLAYLGVRDFTFAAPSAEELEPLLGQRVRAYVVRAEPAAGGAYLQLAPGVAAMLPAGRACDAQPPLRTGGFAECTLLALDVSSRRAYVRLSCAASAEPAPPAEKSEPPLTAGARVAGEVALLTASGCLLHLPDWPHLVVHAHLPQLFEEQKSTGGPAPAELLTPGARVRAEVVYVGPDSRHVHVRLLL